MRNSNARFAFGFSAACFPALVLVCVFLMGAAAGADLSDEDVDLADKTIRGGIEKHFAKPHYAGPKGLMNLKNCDRVKLESQTVGLIPYETGNTGEDAPAKERLLEIPVTLNLSTGRKTDSLESMVKVIATAQPDGGFNFKFDTIRFSEEELSPKDHCADVRKNSRLFTSVQNREILKGMQEFAVKASWGAWKKKSSAGGATILEYDGREVRLRGGLVEAWTQQK